LSGPTSLFEFGFYLAILEAMSPMIGSLNCWLWYALIMQTIVIAKNANAISDPSELKTTATVREMNAIIEITGSPSRQQGR
jgi:hypothetical protein